MRKGGCNREEAGKVLEAIDLRLLKPLANMGVHLKEEEAATGLPCRDFEKRCGDPGRKKSDLCQKIKRRQWKRGQEHRL